MYFVFAWDNEQGGGAGDLYSFSDDLQSCIETAIELTSTERFRKTGHAFDNAHVAGLDDVHGLVIEWEK